MEITAYFWMEPPTKKPTDNAAVATKEVYKNTPSVHCFYRNRGWCINIICTLTATCTCGARSVIILRAKI